MALYSLAQRTSIVTISNTMWSVISAATNKPKIMEMGLTMVTGTAIGIGIGRPAAVGITPTTPVNFLDESDGGGPAGLTTACLAWGTPPTSPTQFLRRFFMPATIGAGVIATFPRGLGMPISQNVTFFNITAGVTTDVYAVVDE
jgi:hypothetical protein